MRLFIVISFFFMVYSLDAQYEKSPILKENDKIEVFFIPGDGYYYEHIIEKGHTLYSLSRAFSLSMDQLVAINDLNNNSTLAVGQKILIPIPTSKLYQKVTPPKSEALVIPVYYKVKPKETLFRIAKMYFNQEIGILQARNNLEGVTLEIDQMLLIGWMLYGDKSISKQMTEVISETEEAPDADEIVVDTSSHLTDTSVEKITRLDSLYNENLNAIPVGFNRELLGGTTYTKDMKVRTKTTVANWDRTIPDNGTAYALHNTARPGTYIKIHNPVVKRAVKARVIGKIPFGTYTNDVKLVISPKAAKILGGLDQRFRVSISYIQ